MFSVQSKSRRNVLPLILLRIAFALALAFTGVVGTHAEAATRLPDLIVSAVSAPSTASSGTTIGISASIKNQGRATSSAFSVSYYGSTSPSSTSGATLLGVQNVASLSAGTSIALVTSLAIPPSAPSGTFYLVVVADSGKAVRESNETNNTRASGAVAVKDVTPPTISSVTSSGITASSATVTWNTDKSSSSQADYGTTAAYGSSTSPSSSLVTSHAVTLSGLTAGKAYHFRVQSKDAAGNTALSTDYTFTTANLAQSPLTLWVTDALTRVQPTDPPGTSMAAILKAARNEHETFQVIVTAPSSADLVGVNVDVSDLIGQTSTIARSNIARYRAHYIPVTVPSENKNEGVKSPNPPGDWPDALVPSTVPGGTYQSFPFTVLAGKNQPVWVEVYVPKGTPAGTYTGTITVTVSDQSPATIPLSLTVWGFTLPDKPTLASEFWSYDLGLRENYIYSNGADRVTLQTNLSADLRNHRLGFGDARQPDATTAEILKRQASINAWTDGLTDTQVITLRDAYPGQLRHQVADEPKTQAAVNAINDPYGAIQHSRSLGMPELLTIADPVAWSANVDIYVAVHYMLDPNLFYWSKTNIQGILSAGKQMWSYAAGLQTNNTPNWLIDFDLIHFRGVPWLDYSTGLTGLLYWTPVNWCPGDPWTNPGTRNDACGYPLNQNMEGTFYYPGDKVGAPNAAIPSARLKALRDGMEDYDYLAILAQLGDPGLAKHLAQTLAPAWDNWSHDPAALASARVLAATRIVELGGQ